MNNPSIFSSLTLAAALAAAGAAYADAATAKALVDAAKAQGVVGERADGYLGFVREVNDDALKAAVKEINEGRAALYAQAATENKVEPAAAGASAFSRFIFPKIPAGQFYRTADGRWLKK
jgi:uncharacterized protein YdbL (DUF1318 family)